MKLKSILLLVFLGLFLFGCSNNSSPTTISTLPQSTESPVISLYGIHEITVNQGSDPINLLSGVSAKDQYNRTYGITITESIDYNTIGSYPITYHVEIEGQRVIEEHSLVHVVINEALNNEIRNQLYLQLQNFQEKASTLPYRFIRKTYDSDNSNHYKFISEHIYEHYSNQTKYTVNTIPEITNEPIRQEIFFEYNQTILGFLMKDSYLYEPAVMDEIPVKNVVNADSTLLKGEYFVTNDGFTINTTYQNMIFFKDANDIFGDIYRVYQYDLTKTYSNVEIIFTFTNQVIGIEVTFDQLDSEYSYYLNYQLDFAASSQTDTSTLSQVEAYSFEDVKIAVVPDINHEITYSMTKTRYLKINVSQDTTYEFTSNLYNLFEFYDSNLQKLSMTLTKLGGDDSYQYIFTSPVDGEIYLKLVRQISIYDEYLTFFYQEYQP